MEASKENNRENATIMKEEGLELKRQTSLRHFGRPEIKALEESLKGLFLGYM